MNFSHLKFLLLLEDIIVSVYITVYIPNYMFTIITWKYLQVANTKLISVKKTCVLGCMNVNLTL